jgi:hypothetical protein
VKKTGFGHVLLLNPNLRGGSPEKFCCPKKCFAPARQHFWEKYGTVVILDRM